MCFILTCLHRRQISFKLESTASQTCTSSDFGPHQLLREIAGTWQILNMSIVLQARWQLLSSTDLLSASCILQLSFLNFFLSQSSKTDQEVAMRHFLHALHYLEEGVIGNIGSMLSSWQQCTVCALGCTYISLSFSRSICYFMYPPMV